mgnify:CR=1 FL=1
MNKLNIKIAFLTGLIVTCYVTLILVSINVNVGNQFILKWLQSWMIAYILVVPSLIFVAPYIRKKLEK